ncbi:hypothetical protein PCE1_001930 [Barthelona sp. PCE]
MKNLSKTPLRLSKRESRIAGAPKSNLKPHFDASEFLRRSRTVSEGGIPMKVTKEQLATQFVKEMRHQQKVATSKASTDDKKTKMVQRTRKRYKMLRVTKSLRGAKVRPSLLSFRSPMVQISSDKMKIIDSKAAPSAMKMPTVPELPEEREINPIVEEAALQGAIGGARTTSARASLASTDLPSKMPSGLPKKISMVDAELEAITRPNDNYEQVALPEPRTFKFKLTPQAEGAKLSGFSFNKNKKKKTTIKRVSIKPPKIDKSLKSGLPPKKTSEAAPVAEEKAVKKKLSLPSKKKSLDLGSALTKKKTNPFSPDSKANATDNTTPKKALGSNPFSMKGKKLKKSKSDTEGEGEEGGKLKMKLPKKLSLKKKTTEA